MTLVASTVFEPTKYAARHSELWPVPNRFLLRLERYFEPCKNVYFGAVAEFGDD
jgi:hypothetical protein